MRWSRSYPLVRQRGDAVGIAVAQREDRCRQVDKYRKISQMTAVFTSALRQSPDARVRVCGRAS